MHLELRGISKRFATVQANDNVQFAVDGGRIVGVLGENGAGKSTLMKILSGFQPADSGDIVMDGQIVRYTGAQQAVSAGIGMLQQDPLDVGAFTVLENFLFGNDSIRSNAVGRTRLAELCARFGFVLDADAWIEQLSIAQRQQLDIVRLLALGVKVLILDEPTTGISATQKQLLFTTLRALARNDGLTVLLVSHKLEDVIALCDEVIVLRMGKLVGGMAAPFTSQQLVTLMFGQEVPAPTRPALSSGAVVLTLDGTLISKRLTVADVHLQVRAGEVIGLAGLDGSGQELLLRAVAGLIAPTPGSLTLHGQPATHLPYRQMMQRGVLFCASGRIEEGLIAGMTLTEHTALMTETAFRVDWQRAAARTAAGIARYLVKGVPQNEIQQLSGGNQQRVLMSLLPDAPSVLALEQPTRGLDVDSVQVIWQRLNEKRQAGTAIVFSSAELDEIMAYSDRIIVFYAGRMVEVADVASVTTDRLGEMMGGSF